MKMYCMGIVMVLLVGCGGVEPPRPSLHEQQEAQRLIDQGTIFLRRAALDEARASFETSYDLLVSAAAMDGLGAVAFLGGDFKGARDYFIAAYQYDETYSQSLSNLALLYDFLGAKEEANELYHRALRKTPDFAEGRNNLAVLLDEQKRRTAAKQELYRGYVVHPHEILGTNLKRIGEKPWQQ